MTETFYIRVDIKSKHKLEYYKEDKDGNEIEYNPHPSESKRFNIQIEKAIKVMFLENVESIAESFDDDEGWSFLKQEALEKVASKFYDVESDLTAITETIEPDIKFKVVRKPKH